MQKVPVQDTSVSSWVLPEQMQIFLLPSHGRRTTSAVNPYACESSRLLLTRHLLTTTGSPLVSKLDSVLLAVSMRRLCLCRKKRRPIERVFGRSPAHNSTLLCQRSAWCCTTGVKTRKQIGARLCWKGWIISDILTSKVRKLFAG